MEQALARRLDFERCMLWGDSMRILLNSSHISPGEINELLREKGIFIDSADKSLTVPLLSSVLLTPSEFERLISRSYSRESMEKYKVEKITLVTPTSDWRKELLQNFESIAGGVDLSPGHSFLDMPTITKRSDGKIEIAYTIRKQDLSQDWIAQELDYSARMILSQNDGKMQLEMQKSHTSKETDRINGIFARSVTRHLKSKSLVKEDAPNGIRFNDFNNEERVQFFIHLTGAADKSFTFEQLVDVDIVRDEAAGKLPSDTAISWMEGKVKRIHVNGEKLDKLDLVTNKAFHKYLHLVKMSADFEYKYATYHGKCSIAFWFGGKHSHETDFSNTEFNISIEKIGRVPKKVEQDIRSKILKSVWEVTDDALNRVIAGRTKASTDTTPLPATV